MSEASRRLEPYRKRQETKANIVVKRNGGFGPRREKLKAEHAIVCQALEIANLALRRAANVEEVIKALSDKEAKRLRKAYAKDLSQAVSAVLNLLLAREIIFSPGLTCGKRYYGSPRAISPEASHIPDVRSRRGRVLILVKNTVNELGRAARVGDVLDYAKAKQEYADIAPVFITRSLLSLVHTGELKNIGSIRGDEKGENLYLPSELDPKTYWPKHPLTWLEEVLRAFYQLWNERKSQAALEKRGIRPISTGDVRSHLSISSERPTNLIDPQVLVNAMQQLSSTKTPAIRKIEREGQRTMLWVPVGIPEEDLDLTSGYVSDAERVGEAVRRAAGRLGRPVSVNEIQQEIDADACLAIASASKLASTVSDVAKETIDCKNHTRRARVTRRVFRVGRIEDQAYYYHEAKGLRGARAYVRFRQIYSKWGADGGGDLFNLLRTCPLQSVAIGRTMLAISESQEILDELERLFEIGGMDKTTRHEAIKLRMLVTKANDDAHQHLASYDQTKPELPTQVSTVIPGWTADELLPIIKPLYRTAQSLSLPRKLTPLLDKQNIRRFRNPEFKYRFSSDPHTAAEFLYDRTDTLLFMARRWGGYECRLQANLAGGTLGRLRDPHFVFPALKSHDFNDRLIAVSCLAFLWSEEGNEQLRQLAINDPDYGVRQSGLWAYYFATRGAGRNFIVKQASDDPHTRVRAFAEQMLQGTGSVPWGF